MLINQLTLKKVLIILVMCSVSLAPLSGKAASQEINSEQLKVIFLYNFINHLGWPNEQSKASFTIAVLNDKDFYQRLKESIHNKLIRGKQISVISSSNFRKIDTADIIYLPSKYNAELANISATFRQTETLLVTNNSPDKHNTMVNLVFNKQTANISFEINKSNILYEKLTMTPKFQLLGGTELDIAQLYRETEKAMQDAKAKEFDLNKKLRAQTEKIQQSEQSLTTLNNKLKINAKELIKYKSEFAKIKNNVAFQKQELSIKEQELKSILEELSKARKELGVQQQLAMKRAEDDKQQIARNKITLLEQEKNIDTQEQKLIKHQTELLGTKQTIDSQKTTILITTSLVAIALAFALLVFFLFVKNKKTTKKLSISIENLEATKDQLVESEKMAAIGSLVAGVAHEINTPLGISVTATSLIYDRTEEIERLLQEKTLSQRHLKSFIDAVKISSNMSTTGLERVIVLLQSFKQVAADQITEEAREINVTSYIEEIMCTLASEMKSRKVTCQFSGNSDVIISTIPGALAQVFTNLVTNSVRHGFENTHNGNITIEVIDENNSVCIIYKDNGQGIKSEDLNKVFKPFFTTKRNKGGTGLGMNIVYNIINQKLGGNIKLSSDYGTGVAFKICLPKEITKT